MNDDDKQDLLLKMYEKLIRLDEKLIALNEANGKEHNQICKEMKDTLLNIDKLTKRVEKLELEGVKIGIFWKVILVVGPIAASVIVNYAMKFINGG